MTEFIIIGIVLAIPIFFGIGYFVWETAISNYGYNIFGIGAILRGLITVVCIFIALVTAEANLYTNITFAWLIIAGIMMLWTFITTLANTNIFIAFFAIIYQFAAALFIFRLINKLFKD